MRIETPEAMEALGRALGEAAPAGTVIALHGDLGAGKSVLARGIARGLGIGGRIPSPTFILVAEYTEGRLPLHHCDLYRLSDPDELVNLGLDEVLGGDGVVVVEWAERFPEILPADHLEVRIAIDGEARDVAIAGTGPVSQRLGSAVG
ncbi:MAG: tRNA (adenosine(37)-N6)-threonylcarbamoyltransferase complex ATPase subunit type 1 TsaE [Alphaproteobacteria bacterium]|nr:tRNA (adenosine(37)-N6)-threonylcarbamoyltransferase complex ATPase subunit type 1 TsaE [Alphaproteobacteria bacterium]